MRADVPTGLRLIPLLLGWGLAASPVFGQSRTMDELWNRFQQGTGRQMHPGISPGGRQDSSYDGLSVYHSGDQQFCSDCHTMHSSMQHNYAGGTGPEGNISSFPWSQTPAPNLLKGANPLDLCLSCHDNVAGIPDVVGADVNGLTLRSGGHFQPPETNPATGHNLGYSPGGLGSALCLRCHFGGNFETAQVQCIDCHTPHGYGNARNLQWASDPGGEPPLGLFVNPASTGLARYEKANVGYGTLDSTTLTEVTSICIDCHHTFSGAFYTDPNGNGIHERHPAYNSEYGDPNTISQGAAKGTTDPGHWEAGTGAGFDVPRVPFLVRNADTFAATQVVDATIDGVFCLSCHFAHGSDEPFSLIWDNPVAGTGATGCDQCHNKSGL